MHRLYDKNYASMIMASIIVENPFLTVFGMMSLFNDLYFLLDFKIPIIIVSHSL